MVGYVLSNSVLPDDMYSLCFRLVLTYWQDVSILIGKMFRKKCGSNMVVVVHV